MGFENGQVRRIFPHHGGGREKQRGRVRLVRGGGGGGIGLSCKHIVTTTDNCMVNPMADSCGV